MKNTYDVTVGLPAALDSQRQTIDCIDRIEDEKAWDKTWRQTIDCRELQTKTWEIGSKQNVSRGGYELMIDSLQNLFLL